MSKSQQEHLKTTHLETEHLWDLLHIYKETLKEYRHFIDSLNVYPVPDGDTGTNMYLTMESVISELESVDKADLKGICSSATKGAVMGARGNSGVILSQIVKGFMNTFAESGTEPAGVLDAKAWMEGSCLAASFAYGAVSEPVEGTILTVIREISEGGKDALQKGAELPQLVQSFLQTGRVSLENTTQQLEVLKKANVVDAGGVGLVLFFDVLRFLVDGTEIEPPPQTTQNVKKMSQDLQSSDLGTRYEVMYLLTAEEKDIPAFRKAWEDLGDSIVISGVEGVWNCHIHTDEIGLAIEAGIKLGTPQNIKVTDLHEQTAHNDEHLSETQKGASGDFILLDSTLDNPKTQIVLTGQGVGLAQLFTSLGARVMVIGGQTRNPSTQSMVDGLNSLDSEEAIILPNNSNIYSVAKTAAEQVDMAVEVVETKSIMEGLAVLLAYDPMASALVNAKSMENVRAGVATGEVTKAVRDAEEMGIQHGDYIGLNSKKVLTKSKSLVDATCDLLAELIEESHDLLTLVTGREAVEPDTNEILAWLEANKPTLEVEVCFGGQDLYYYYIGLE